MSRLSPAIYWRRRLLVLAAVFLLGWVVTTLVQGGDDTKPTADPQPTPSATPSAGGSPSVSASPSPVPSPTLDAATQVSLPAGGDRCDPSLVRIQPSVPAGQKAGSALRIDFLVTTSAEEACTLVPKGRETLVVVTAGETPAWDSSACSSPVIGEPVRLNPGWATLARGASGNLSTAACAKGDGFRYAGTFQVRAALLGGEPSEATFKIGGLTRAQAEEKARAEARRKAAEAKKKAAEEKARKKAAAEKKKAEEAARRKAEQQAAAQQTPAPPAG